MRMIPGCSLSINLIEIPLFNGLVAQKLHRETALLTTESSLAKLFIVSSGWRFVDEDGKGKEQNLRAKRLPVVLFV